MEQKTKQKSPTNKIPGEIVFKIYLREQQHFEDIKKELGHKNGSQTFRRLLYAWDELKMIKKG